MFYIDLFREYDPSQVVLILSWTIQIRRNWLWLPQAIQHHADLHKTNILKNILVLGQKVAASDLVNRVTNQSIAHLI